MIIQFVLFIKRFSASTAEKVFDSRVNSSYVSIQMSLLEELRSAFVALKVSRFAVIHFMILQLGRRQKGLLANFASMRQIAFAVNSLNVQFQVDPLIEGFSAKFALEGQFSAVGQAMPTEKFALQKSFVANIALELSLAHVKSNVALKFALR